MKVGDRVKLAQGYIDELQASDNVREYLTGHRGVIISLMPQKKEGWVGVQWGDKSGSHSLSVDRVIDLEVIDGQDELVKGQPIDKPLIG